MSNEEWKPIPEYDGYYEASSMRRIRSVDRVDNMGRFRKGKIISTIKKGNGYLYFTGTVDGKRKNMYVHRAVVSAFIGSNAADGLEIDHIDCNKEHNSIDNLDIVTSKENKRRASDNGLLIKRNRTLTKEQVLSIRRDRRPQRVVANEVGMSTTVISLIKSGSIYKDITDGAVERTSKGENSPLRKLTDDQVRSIRSDSRTAKEIARDYGCGLSTVYNVKEGRSYKWVA